LSVRDFFYESSNRVITPTTSLWKSRQFGYRQLVIVR
jgi:hypothetical protein